MVTSVISAVSPVRQAAAIERTAGSASLASASNASRSAALTGLGRPVDGAAAGVVAVTRRGGGRLPRSLRSGHQDVGGRLGGAVGRRKLTPQPVTCSGHRMGVPAAAADLHGVRDTGQPPERPAGLALTTGHGPRAAGNRDG